ncbi:MAG TPA: shikimate kinase [Myxococcota bacterium]|nr:shikimate kinase [Myxococcota bacterium]
MIPQKLALAGPMGVGKSTVGKLLAARHGRSFVDLDQEIGDIPAIWAQEGEAGFRQRERATLEKVVGREAVLALGGGTVVDPNNRAMLEGWKVVVLMAPVAVLAQRIGGSGRPLAGQMEALWQRRQESWRAAGPWVEAEGDPEQVADAVEALCA